MQIQELRLSFIQIETVIAPLAALKPPKIPYAFLLTDTDFPEEFAAAIKKTSPRWPPWRDGTGKFWFEYFNKIDPDSRTKKDAWQGLVPLETKCLIPAPASPIAATITTRAFLYPWGIGTIADVAVKQSLSLADAVKFAFNIKGKLLFNVTSAGTAKSLSLLAAMSSVIADLRDTAYGPGIASSKGDPFSIVTVLDADGVVLTNPIDDSVHQALEGLTGWAPLWNAISPGDLKTSSIKGKRGPVSHVVYKGQRGRTVWFPGFFKSVATDADTLDRYHNNLLMSTLQTDSLCRLIDAANQQLNSGAKVADWSQAYQNCVRMAAGLLARIYGGVKTYRTRSNKEQIKTFLPAVNAVRDVFGMDALKVNPAPAKVAPAVPPAAPASSAPK